MKSFFSLVFVLLVLAAVVGGGGLLFYLSQTSEFTRKDKRPAAEAAPGTTQPAIRPHSSQGPGR